MEPEAQGGCRSSDEVKPTFMVVKLGIFEVVIGPSFIEFQRNSGRASEM